MSGNSLTKSLESECVIFELDESWIDAVFDLEQICSQNPWSRAVLKRELERGFSLRPGLTLNGELIGQSFSYLVKDELHILNVAVLPKYRGCGLGRALLNHILSIAKSKGVVVATLEVRESNQIAQSLYKSLEFCHIGTRKAYYQNNGEDALVLEKRLENHLELAV